MHSYFTPQEGILHGGEEEDPLGPLPDGWEKRVRPDGKFDLKLKRCHQIRNGL